MTSTESVGAHRPWDQAMCSIRPDLPWTAEWFEASGTVAEDEMVQICATCPAQGACMELAVETSAGLGFWAGRWRFRLWWLDPGTPETSDSSDDPVFWLALSKAEAL